METQGTLSRADEKSALNFSSFLLVDEFMVK
jgi:hypothetical protein